VLRRLVVLQLACGTSAAAGACWARDGLLKSCSALPCVQVGVLRRLVVLQVGYGNGAAVAALLDALGRRATALLRQCATWRLGRCATPAMVWILVSNPALHAGRSRQHCLQA
jgi:hypothetical protein